MVLGNSILTGSIDTVMYEGIGKNEKKKHNGEFVKVSRNAHVGCPFLWGFKNSLERPIC